MPFNPERTMYEPNSNFNPERTMQDLGGRKIEAVDSEASLLAAAEQVQNFNELEELVDSYNLKHFPDSTGLNYTVDGSKDYVSFRRSFPDRDAYIVFRNRKMDLIQREKMQTGDTVTVRRTSGGMETDWRIDSIDNGLVTVKKDNLSKQIRYDSLFEMNTADRRFGR